MATLPQHQCPAPLFARPLSLSLRARPSSTLSLSLSLSLTPFSPRATHLPPPLPFLGTLAFHAAHISCAIFCLAATFQVVKRRATPAPAASR